MIVAVFSDVHGNLPALEKFVRSTRAIADRYVCLGDVVNYGPWNDECLELVNSLPGIVLLEGNHERLFLGAVSIQEEIALVREFYEHSIRYFTRRDLIAALPTSFQLDRFICKHTIDERKVYADTGIEVTCNYMIGHTHQQYQIERSGKLIVNPGSIGQNRKDIDIFNYALYETSSHNITLCEEFCPIDQFVAELVARRYPQACIDYYRNKRGVSRE
jgi:predicted phosphodiesterase